MFLALIFEQKPAQDLTLIGMSYESKKNAHLGASFVRLNELGRVSNYPD